MRLNCPFCGSRYLAEFTYQGDANRARPAPKETDQTIWNDYVYGRKNPRGLHKEFWLHAGGCRAHLIVERDTATHKITNIAYADGSKA